MIGLMTIGTQTHTKSMSVFISLCYPGFLETWPDWTEASRGTREARLAPGMRGGRGASRHEARSGREAFDLGREPAAAPTGVGRPRRGVASSAFAAHQPPLEQEEEVQPRLWEPALREPTEPSSLLEDEAPADDGADGGRSEGKGGTEAAFTAKAAAELGRQDACGEGHGGDHSGVLLVDKRSVRRADSAPPGKRVAVAEANVSASGNPCILADCGTRQSCARVEVRSGVGSEREPAIAMLCLQAEMPAVA